MSNPPNKLASFRSYSYYHVLAMCDSSDTAHALSTSTDPTVWDHATQSTRVMDDRQQTTELGPYSPKEVPPGGKYIILINGSTDASYVITQAKWTSATGATAAPQDRSTSIAVEGSMTVSEPKGVAFLDQVVKCCSALGVDTAQVYYVLKTFFIGFRDDEMTVDGAGSRADFISDIPPITFLVYDVAGTFTEAGGQYQIEFVAAAHGASRLPQYSKAVSSMSITAGNSLEETMTRLQDAINANYDNYYNCVVEQIKSTQGDSGDMVKALRRVKYVIEVGEAYKDGKGAKYTVTNQPQHYKNSAGCNDTAQITLPGSTSIETAIHTIMSMSDQVAADMAVGDTSTRERYEYKIHTALASEQAAGEDAGMFNYTVYYRVERFLSPKTISYNPAFAVLQGDQDQIEKDPSYQLIKQNIIEFDYMYTGKNIDILDFEMKVNMGMAYLQTATLANTFKSQLQRASNRTMQPSGQDAANHMMRTGTLVQTPVFFGTQIRTPHLTTTQNPTNTIQSAYTLTKHSSLEVSDVTMRIIGNTKLLGTTNAATSPYMCMRSADRTTPLSENHQPISTNEANFTDWSFVPAYAKINIKMPRDNDDFALFTGQSTPGDTSPGSTDYARDFWFDGYYYVVGIEHLFDGGEFSQTLSMVGLPKRSAFEAANATATQEKSFTTMVGSCYDNQIGISPAATAQGASDVPPVTPHTPPSGNTQPTNKADADTANRTARSPSDVIGWDAASPQVRDAIERASQSSGVDVVVMAQFAAKESSLGLNLSAHPRSSATGLFQFLQGTWNDMIDRKRVSSSIQRSTQQTHRGSRQNWDAPRPTDPRLNHYTNATVGAAFLQDNIRIIGSSSVGDLYLAHFLGAGTAKQVIAADNRNSSQLFVNAVDAKGAAAAMAANPTIIKPNTTVGHLREWAARAMASTLKNPIKNATQRRPPTQTTAAAQSTGSTPVQPTGVDPAAKRDAAASVATIQNNRVQSNNPGAAPCTPSPTTTPQDRPRGSQ